MNQELVGTFKEKLKELSAAKKIVKNLEREIEDMEEELDEDLRDLEG